MGDENVAGGMMLVLRIMALGGLAVIVGLAYEEWNTERRAGTLLLSGILIVSFVAAVLL